jgi:hypothetical protein
MSGFFSSLFGRKPKPGTPESDAAIAKQKAAADATAAATATAAAANAASAAAAAAALANAKPIEYEFADDTNGRAMAAVWSKYDVEPEGVCTLN